MIQADGLKVLLHVGICTGRAFETAAVFRENIAELVEIFRAHISAVDDQAVIHGPGVLVEGIISHRHA